MPDDCKSRNGLSGSQQISPPLLFWARMCCFLQKRALHMIKRGFLLAGLLLPGSLAWAFPFEVSETVKGVKVAVDTMDLGDNTGAVTLENYGTVAAQCNVRFRSGPGVPVVRNARLESGQKAHLTAGFNHQVIRMRVDVRCKPAKAGK